jgi:hypothetical protein
MNRGKRCGDPAARHLLPHLLCASMLGSFLVSLMLCA